MVIRKIIRRLTDIQESRCVRSCSFFQNIFLVRCLHMFMFMHFPKQHGFSSLSSLFHIFFVSRLCHVSLSSLSPFSSLVSSPLSLLLFLSFSLCLHLFLGGCGLSLSLSSSVRLHTDLTLLHSCTFPERVTNQSKHHRDKIDKEYRGETE